MRKTGIFFTLLLVALLNTINLAGQEKHSWIIGDPIFDAGPEGTFDEIAVKDPSVVYFENEWHLFYTARSKVEYITGYTRAKSLEELNNAPRYELKQLRGKSRYGCAPQIFYFEPHGKWYLIFQNRDSNYQPAYSTNINISEPDQWSAALPLMEKDKKQKWIDFWIIADKTKIYLFYTEGHSGVMVRSTGYEDFPKGWNKSKKVLNDVHEAVHIYKVKGKNEYHMIYELNEEGIRSFGLAKANNPDGNWEKVTDAYATGGQLKYIENAVLWTEMISHGEAIRTGHDQFMEYDADNCRWLIQGIMKSELGPDYPSLPWKLGIIKKKMQ